MVHVIHSQPDAGPGLQVKVAKPFKAVPAPVHAKGTGKGILIVLRLVVVGQVVKEMPGLARRMVTNWLTSHGALPARF